MMPAAALGVAWLAITGGPPDATRSTAPPPQSIQIEVRGAIALVTVTRTFPALSGGGAGAREEILDIALPDHAALLDVEADSDGRFAATSTVTAAHGRDAYTEALRAMGLTAREAPFDDDATTRVRVAHRARGLSRGLRVRYQFSALLDMADGRAQLAFPAAPEPSAPAETRVQVRVDAGLRPTDVTIAGAAHPLRPGAAPVATEIISTRRGWLVSLGFARPAGGAAPSRLTAIAARAPATAGGAGGSGGTAPATQVACAVGLSPGPEQALPERVLFVVDRSRSVGPGGLEAERESAKRVLMVLPPSTRFDALFFDRGQKRLFPLPRAATRAALGALEDEMVPARLANGTELTAALRAAGDLMRREPTSFAPRALLVVLSDGAIGRGRLDDLVGRVPGVDLMTAAIEVRPDDDPSISPDERHVLRSLAATARTGGVERELRAGEIADAIPAALGALRVGGDVYTVRVGGAALADAIAPGQGQAGIVSLGGKSGRSDRPQRTKLLTLSWLDRGEARAAALRPVEVNPRWLSPLASPPRPETRVLLDPAAVVLVEPVVRPAEVASAHGPSGFLERSVVRDALSLAFTPRAHACYVNRTAATPAERDLSGRVRLALDLVRGEVGAARIESSTLVHPVIENCLREAAFALEVPRAYRNDEPVTAILNLVFRPRTPERTATPGNAGINREIDLLIEGALQDQGAPRDAGPGAD